MRDIGFEEYIECSTESMPLLPMCPISVLLPTSLLQYNPCHFKSLEIVMENQYIGENLSGALNALTRLKLSSIEPARPHSPLSHSGASESAPQKTDRNSADTEANLGMEGKLMTNLSRSEKQSVVYTAQSDITQVTKDGIQRTIPDLIRSTGSQNAPQNILSSGLLMTLECLHRRVSQIYNSDSEVYEDRLAIAAVVSSSGISPGVSLSIAEQLLPSHSSAKVSISGLRVSVVHPFTRNDYLWAVLEWREDNHTDVIGIFHVDVGDDSDSTINGLMHYGYGGRNDRTSRECWNNTSVLWTVTSFGHLKLLFGAARHILGILELPVNDSFTLCCETDEQMCSEEAQAKYAKLVCIHLLKLQEADTAFDELASKLYHLSSKQVLQRCDGTQYSVFRGRCPQ